MNAKPEIQNPTVCSVIKHKIEVDTQKKVNQNVGKTLVQIMEEGAKEFQKNTGRNMTYSEMREMYG